MSYDTDLRILPATEIRKKMIMGIRGIELGGTENIFKGDLDLEVEGVLDNSLDTGTPKVLYVGQVLDDLQVFIEALDAEGYLVHEKRWLNLGLEGYTTEQTTLTEFIEKVTLLLWAYENNKGKQTSANLIEYHLGIEQGVHLDGSVGYINMEVSYGACVLGELNIVYIRVEQESK